jgi:tetratricopeptide (TPR) repeat protein
VRQGLYAKARPLLLGVAQWSPDMPEPVFNLARIWWEQGNADSALMYYDYALRRDPTFVEALNNKGSVLESMGNTVRARLAWKRATRLDAGYESAARNLIRSFLSESFTDSAQAVLNAATDPWLKSADWYYQSAQVAIAGGDKRAAGLIIQESLTRYPNHPQLQNLRRQLQQNP